MTITLNRLSEHNEITLVWSSIQPSRHTMAVKNELLAMNRNRLRLYIGFLTEHWVFKIHLFNLGLVESRWRVDADFFLFLW